eukprot:jgi/Mesvir1/4741/Mv26267-RA.1
MHDRKSLEVVIFQSQSGSTSEGTLGGVGTWSLANQNSQVCCSNHAVSCLGDGMLRWWA